MKKLMSFKGAQTLSVSEQKVVNGGGNPPTPSIQNYTAVAEIAPCQYDNVCPTRQICCLGNCGIEI